VTGRPGTGKTTLIGELIENLADDNVGTATLVCTQVQADDLLKMVAYNFGVESRFLKKAELLQSLHVLLNNWHREGRRALLVVDEAQNLSISAMEELRLLTNIQADGVPLLQIFLLGQPELRELVLSPQMEQVHQRIVGTSHIAALEPDETEAYIRYRLEKVDWQGDPAISKKVYPLIHKYSDGIPRRVNLICSRLFLYGCIEQKHEIGIRDIREILLELQGETLAAGPVVSEFDFEGDDEFESPPPSRDAQEKAAPGSSTTPADSSSPGGVDATPVDASQEVVTKPTLADVAAPAPQPQHSPRHISQTLEVDHENSPNTGKGRRGAVARRGAISMALFVFLIALVLSGLKYGAGVDFGKVWRKLGGALLVSEHKPLQALPADPKPQEVTPRSNDISASGTVRDKPLTDSSGAALQDGGPLERSSPDLPTVGQQSLQDESFDSGAEPEALSSLLPATVVEDPQAIKSKVPADPPAEQVLLPSAKTIYQIDFDFASANLTDGAHTILNLAIEKMNMQAGSAAIVRGFSDGTGSKSYQEELSRERVAAVLAYMDAAGIEGQRLQIAKVEQPIQAALNPATATEPGGTKIKTVEMTVAWIERD